MKRRRKDDAAERGAGEAGAGGGETVPAAPPPAPASPGMGLACRGVSFTYQVAGSSVPALRAVDFELPPATGTALLGASGSGKTTLLQILRGLDAPDRGEIVLDGRGGTDPEYAERQRQIGLVFQIPELQLFASTAREDAAFGPRCLGWGDDESVAAAEEALERVGLPVTRFGDRHPYALSGGERRRLALAGVLAMRPRLLLLDEPFVSLDPGTRRELTEILGRLKSEGITILLATHDIDLAWALCKNVLVLADGEVVARGAWDVADGGLLAANRLREPFFVELWRRLGRDPASAPRTVAQAAEALI